MVECKLVYVMRLDCYHAGYHDEWFPFWFVCPTCGERKRVISVDRKYVPVEKLRQS